MVNCIYPLGFPIQNSIVLSVGFFPAAAGEISIVSTIKPDASLRSPMESAVRRPSTGWLTPLRDLRTAYSLIALLTNYNFDRILEQNANAPRANAKSSGVLVKSIPGRRQLRCLIYLNAYRSWLQVVYPSSVEKKRIALSQQAVK